MESAFVDNPLFLSVAFHPRKAFPEQSTDGSIIDGLVPVDGSVSLGYRFHVPPAITHETPVFIYFHGNAEIAPDYDSAAAIFRGNGAGLVIVDYRGYGWSTGEPLLSTLLSDAEVVVRNIDSILEKGGARDCAIILFGRSIGSCCAIHLAYKFPQRFYGVVLESPITSVTELPLVQQFAMMLPPDQDLSSMLPDLYKNVWKMERCSVPLLVIHGDDDEIVPVSHGVRLYEASSSAIKALKRLPGAGHNNLILMHQDAYYGAVFQFVEGLFIQRRLSTG